MDGRFGTRLRTGASDAGHQSRTVEISWRLLRRGSKRPQISQFQLEEAQAELELRYLQIKQEQREVERQKEIANNHLIAPTLARKTPNFGWRNNLPLQRNADWSSRTTTSR